MELVKEEGLVNKSELYEPIQEFLPLYVQNLYDSEKPKAQELAEELTIYCLDKGLSRNPSITVKTELGFQTFSAEPVAMLSRSALISHIEDVYEGPEQARGHLAIRFLDIHDMKLSNEVESEEASDLYRGADVLINNVCQKVNEVLDGVNLVLKETGGRVSAGRYGGDEIALLFESVDSPEVRQQIFDRVIGKEVGAESAEGLFLRGGTISLEKVDIKEGFEEVTVPEDDVGGKVWWNQMTKGLILSKNEVEEIIKSKNDTKEIESKNKLENLSEEELISEGKDITKRVASIIKRHPELSKAFDLTISLPYNTLKDAVQNMSDFENFIKGTFNDRLLGEHVSTMHDFALRFLEKVPSRIHIVDLKGIKELNDVYSMAKGDEGIVRMWEQIEEVLKSKGEINAHVKVFRRGSTVIVAENEEILTPEQVEKLSNISRVDIQVNNGVVSPNVVSKTIDYKELNSFPNVKTTKELRGVLDSMFQEIEYEWNFRQIKKYMDNPEVFLGLKVNKDEVKTGKNALNEEEFYNLFLFGSNRTNERLSGMLNTVNLILKSPESSEEVEKLAIIRNLVQKQLQNQQ